MACHGRETAEGPQDARTSRVQMPEDGKSGLRAAGLLLQKSPGWSQNAVPHN